MYREIHNEFNEWGLISVMVDIDGVVNEDCFGEQLQAFNEGIKNKEYIDKCDESYIRTIFFQQ